MCSMCLSSRTLLTFVCTDQVWLSSTTKFLDSLSLHFQVARYSPESNTIYGSHACCPSRRCSHFQELCCLIPAYNGTYTNTPSSGRVFQCETVGRHKLEVRKLVSQTIFSQFLLLCRATAKDNHSIITYNAMFPAMKYCCLW